MRRRKSQRAEEHTASRTKGSEEAVSEATPKNRAKDAAWGTTRNAEKGVTRAYLLALATPIIIENLLQTMLGTVDAYFAGSISDEAIAGVGVTGIVMNVLVALFVAVGTASVALIARRHGAEDDQGARSAITSSVALALGLGAAVGLFCGVFADPLLRATGLEGPAIEITLPYFVAVSVPSIFTALQMSASSCMRALEDTRTPMIVSGVTNMANIGLNIAFLMAGFGLLGLGIATSISRAAGAMALVALLVRRGWLTLSPDCLSRTDLKALIHIGAPAGAEKIAQRAGQLVYTTLIVSLGTNAYAAHNIAGNIESYAYIPAMGFGLAASTVVGIALGENNPDKAREEAWVSWRIATLIMVAIAAVFFAFAPNFAALFSETPEVQEQAASVLRIIALFQPFAALVQVMGGALQGAGDTRFPLFATLVGIWVIRLGIGSVFAVVLDLGLTGIWYAYALDLVVRGLLLTGRFKRGAWASLKLE